jgi:predicted Zn finger-like uncharacterized protein
MSFVTQCPSCSSLFQVVADQLRVSKGWVRCGVCGQAFEAKPHEDGEVAKAELDLHRHKAPSTHAAVKPEQSSNLPASKAAAPNTAPDASPDAAWNWTSSDSQDAPMSLPAGSEVWAEPPEVAAPTGLPEVVVHAQSEPEPEPEPKTGPKALPHALPPAHDPLHAEPDTVGFVAQAQAAQQARKRVVWWVLGALVLGFGLLLQWAVHERHLLATRYSFLREPLIGVCESLGCQVHAPQLPQSLLVDASQFNLVRSNLYKLTVVVRNSSNLPVQAPHLELTLTNFNDDASARRVLSPADLGLFAPNLAPQAEWTGSAVFRLGPGSLQADGKVAGYRVVAFYP